MGTRSNKTRMSFGPTATKHEKITMDTPLTPVEQKFVQEYMKTSNGAEALKATGIELAENQYAAQARKMLRQPNVQSEIIRIMDEIHDSAVASGLEVLSYFTKVMRGDIKDQFGLDAPLAERTKAAQELAKRTVDIDNRRLGEADQIVEIKLDWNRSN